MKEQASYNFLIIRMVCAIVLFLAIFLIDKFDLKIGDFNTNMIQEYVTGKDNMKYLEERIVTWIKEDN